MFLLEIKHWNQRGVLSMYWLVEYKSVTCSDYLYLFKIFSLSSQYYDNIHPDMVPGDSNSLLLT